MPTVGGRGFLALHGETVTCVDTSAINVVHIHCKSGKVISVDSESSHYGIPVIQVGQGWDVNENKHLKPTHVYERGTACEIFYGMVGDRWHAFFTDEAKSNGWSHMESASCYNGEIDTSKLELI